MQRIKFDEISVKGVKRWKDPDTGKSRQETRKFWQTYNPFNTNADGSIKSRDQIRDEITAARNAWLNT